jgi:hypothetical protein
MWLALTSRSSLLRLWSKMQTFIIVLVCSLAWTILKNLAPGIMHAYCVQQEAHSMQWHQKHFSVAVLSSTFEANDTSN